MSRRISIFVFPFIVFSFLNLLHVLFSKRHEHRKVDLCDIQVATIISSSSSGSSSIIIFRIIVSIII